MVLLNPLESRPVSSRDLSWARYGVAFGAVGYACVAAFGLLTAIPTLRDRVQEGIVAAVLAASFALWDRSPRVASALAVGVVWAEITASTVYTGSTFSIGILAYPVVVAFGGLMLGGRFALGLGLLVAVGLPAEILAHHLWAGTLDVLVPYDALALMVSGFVNAAMGLVVHLAMREYAGLFRGSERARLRYEDLFESAPDGLVSVDDDGRIEDANAMARRLLESESTSLRGRLLASVLQTAGGPAGVEISDARPGAPLMVQFGGPEGSARALEIAVRNRTAAPLTGRLVSIRDVTEKRMIEERLGHSQRMETVGRLAGGVAHDFNNLLTVIGGNASLLAEEGNLGAPLALEILDAQRRGVALTRQLLSFARREVRHPENVDVGAVVAELARLLERLLGEQRPLRLACQPSISVLADRSQIEQVVINLVTNARDAMPSGGPVDVRVRGLSRAEAAPLGSRLTAPDQVLIEVEDAGVGIGTAIRDRIFEPFFTTKPRGSGTGLGLATVHGILLQTDGMVAVDSAPSFGSRFRCFLPRQATMNVDSGTPRWRAASGDGEQILLVEDDGPVGQLAERLLLRAGYRVTRVSNADDALAVSKVLGYDLLLTDVVMPGMSGPELATRLRMRSPKLPVLFMSGYFEPGTTSGDDKTLLSRDNLLSKPFSSKDLLRRVRDTLDAKA